MAGGALPLNWGMSELLAYGTLLHEGYPLDLLDGILGEEHFRIDMR